MYRRIFPLKWGSKKMLRYECRSAFIEGERDSCVSRHSNANANAMKSAMSVNFRSCCFTTLCLSAANTLLSTFDVFIFGLNDIFLLRNLPKQYRSFISVNGSLEIKIKKSLPIFYRSTFESPLAGVSTNDIVFADQTLTHSHKIMGKLLKCSRGNIFAVRTFNKHEEKKTN